MKRSIGDLADLFLEVRRTRPTQADDNLKRALKRRSA